MDSSSLFMIGLVIVGFGSYTMAMLDVLNKDKNKKKLRDLAKYNKRYNTLYNNFFTRKAFHRIVEQLSAMQIYSIMEVRVQAVKIYQNTSFISLVVLLLGAISVDDIVTFFVLALFVVMMNDIMVQKKIDISQVELTLALSSAIASLRDSYTKCGEIAEAIRTCERSRILDKTFENIYSILTEADADSRLNQFYMTQQLAVLRTLATVCYTLDRYGDGSSVDDNGVGAFKQALMFIKDEVDLAVRKNVKKKLLFGKIEYLPVVPIVFIGIIQQFFMSNIPGTSILYKGFYGYAVKLVLIAVSMYSYNYIANVTRANYSRVDDRARIVDRFLDKEWFNKLVQRVQTKKAKAIHSYKKLLAGSLSNKDIVYIYAEKLLISSIVFVITFIATVLIVLSYKRFIYNNINTFSLTQTVAFTVEEEEKIRAYDEAILTMEALPPDEEIHERISYILTKASELDIGDQVSRIKSKWKSYKNTYYHWWFSLIVIGITLIAWHIPEMFIKQRKRLITIEAEEDVLQMQTIVLILSTTTLDTAEVIYWLGRNSSIHRDHLNFCYQEYPADPEKAIARLKKNSVIPEFHQLCDKLALTAFRISLEEAFSDLVPERSHLMKIREMAQDNELTVKRNKSSPLAQAPLYVMIFGLVVGPVLILGISQYMQTMSSMNF